MNESFGDIFMGQKTFISFRVIFSTTLSNSSKAFLLADFSQEKGSLQKKEKKLIVGSALQLFPSCKFIALVLFPQKVDWLQETELGTKLMDQDLSKSLLNV